MGSVTTFPATLGKDIRALRKSRKMTLDELAQRLDRSVGWVSQVERDISTPTMDDLRQIAGVFDVPLSLFFGTATAAVNEQGQIVRASARRAIGERESGLIETLISPDLTDDFEVIHSTFNPGSSIEHTVKRPTTEVGYLISGKLDIWIEGEPFTVEAGDSFRIKEAAFRWANPYDVPAVSVWVISPPIY
ncbi:helix-turn-helix domain-containing protein [Actibacterium pelagium]|uniref:XRE family transcriptional regulator n=1 Tax=Actibacterium pelagium TaxID=2029103 RepID=A0A917AE70_9RHOB|nr:XRE family transcriptional regulator [Actibacterium pelagium]GGE44424.1 XRE family transcriptional regulator [Actibacterium pelagium]